MSEIIRPLAVGDAGPLIHLGEIGSARLLVQFHPLIVPARVRQEAASFHPPADFDVEIVTVTDADRDAISQRLRITLDAGELDCLALCQRHPAAIFLTDDLAARREAQRLGVPVHGSVGVIVRAFPVGLLAHAEADAALIALRDCRSLFVTKAIINLAREQLAGGVKPPP